MRFFKVLSMVILLTVLVGSLISDDQKFSAQDKATFKGAKIHRKDGRYEKAFPMFEELLTKYPDNLQVIYNISLCHYYTENYLEANKFFDKAIELTNTVIEKIKKENADNPKKADKEIKKFSKDIDKNFSLEKIQKFKTSIYQKLYNNIYEQYKNENYDEVISQASTLLEIAPDSSNVVVFIMNSYLKKEDYDNAIKYRIKISEIEPDNAIVKSQIADYYYNINDYENALNWYLEVIKLDENNTDVLFTMGLCYEQLEKPEKALETFEKIIELDPQNLDAIFNSRVFASNLELNDKKLKYWKMEIDLAGDELDVQDLSYLCYELYNSEKYDDVLKYAKLWYNNDNTSKEAVQLLYQSAKKSGEKDLEQKYEKIYQEMP
ncbi:MAG TPA: tetratricopeptide repeat protein [Candidatus Cloacimonetes bacterium]|nr:tetratricopeptide repeat protein [Candidatus Cloacimonadota bacterium]